MRWREEMKERGEVGSERERGEGGIQRVRGRGGRYDSVTKTPMLRTLVENVNGI